MIALTVTQRQRRIRDAALGATCPVGGTGGHGYPEA